MIVQAAGIVLAYAFFNEKRQATILVLDYYFVFSNPSSRHCALQFTFCKFQCAVIDGNILHLRSVDKAGKDMLRIEST
jgi:hypothetical protein